MKHSVVDRWVSKGLILSMLISTTPFSAVSAVAGESSLRLPANDMIAPSIDLPSNKPTTPPNTSCTIKAKVTDNQQVQSVVLFYRQIGEENYRAKQMSKQSQSDDYEVELTADEIGKNGIEYYLQAKDVAGNSVLRGYSFSPIALRVKPEAAPVSVVPAVIPAPVTEQQKQENFGKVVHEQLSEKKESSSSNKWLWIGLGTLVVLGLAGGGGGGGGGGDPGPVILTPTGDLSGTVPAPK